MEDSIQYNTTTQQNQDEDDYLVETLADRKTLLSRVQGQWMVGNGLRTINRWELMQVYMNDSELREGIGKRVKDIINGGFEISGENPKIPGPLTDKIMQFFTSDEIKFNHHIRNALRDARVYGNGYIEILFDEDANIPASAPPTTTTPAGFAAVSPMTITIVECRDISDKENFGKIVGYLQRQTYFENSPGITLVIDEETAKSTLYENDLFIHPDRIINVSFDTLSDSPVGISSIETGYNILVSKAKADKLVGTIITRYAKPIFNGVLKGPRNKENERDAYRKLMNLNDDSNDVSVITHNEAFDVNIIGASGKPLQAEPYLNYLREQTAIVAGVPQSLLVGSLKGASGDNNMISYFKSISIDQNDIVTPIIKLLVRGLFTGETGREYVGKIIVKWNPNYADEIAEIKGNFMSAQNIISAINTKPSLVPLDAARKKVCELLGVEYSENPDDYAQAEGGGTPIQDTPGAVQPGTDAGGSVAGTVDGGK